MDEQNQTDQAGAIERIEERLKALEAELAVRDLALRRLARVIDNGRADTVASDVLAVTLAADGECVKVSNPKRIAAFVG